MLSFPECISYPLRFCLPLPLLHAAAVHLAVAFTESVAVAVDVAAAADVVKYKGLQLRRPGETENKKARLVEKQNQQLQRQKEETAYGT